ncbi:STT3 domain-containing protein [Methanobacterium sp.]|uniref:STT3 domain-containing protein n=1 Tax=Methanobacterium sp. TaxID=2164 RepID=UPI003C754F71
MNAKILLSKSKPIIIIVLLFILAFSLRADAVNIGGVPQNYTSLFEDQNGLPYFSEMDSYYNYRMTQDYLDHGYLGDTIQNGTSWDLHSAYPAGRSATSNALIVYITAFAYKLANLFGNVPLNEVCIWVAPFMASLAVIPAYLFVRRLSNDYGGIVAGILVGLAPAYFMHTFAGFFDTDMFNMLFPILIVGFFIMSILTKDIKTRSIYVVLSAISLLVYSVAWEGWWYMFYLLIGTAVVYILVSNYLLKMKTIKPFKEYPDKAKWLMDQHALFSLVVFAVLSTVLMSIYWGPSGFISTLTGSIGFSELHSTLQGTSYPNIYVSVGELQLPSISSVVSEVGGIIPFVLGILVVPLLLWKLKPEGTKKANNNVQNTPKRKSKPRRKAKKTKTEVAQKEVKKSSIITDPQILETKKHYLLYAVLFAVWLVGTGLMLKQGSRFLEQFALPIALGAGLFVGLIVPYIKKHVKNVTYCTLAIVIVVAAVAYSPVYGAYGTSSAVVPGTDGSMYNSLTWIGNNTSQNTVLTSWWDFGHMFTAVADRPVTFDGGSQNTPRAYWVGKALTTSNESLSAGILRMLTSSGDLGYSTLENYTHNTGKSVEILDKILPVDKQAAQTILTSQYNLTAEQAQNVLKYTHPDSPAPHELILSTDMINKAGVWSYFGSWNFQNNTGQGYSYAAGQATTQQVNGTTVIGTALSSTAAVVAQINGTKIAAGLQYQENNQTQVMEPHKLIVVQNGSVKLNQVVSNDSEFSIILINQNNTYVTVIMNKEMEDSMFTRMFFENGAGLSQFKLVHTEGGILDPYGTQVWNVNS